MPSRHRTVFALIVVVIITVSLGACEQVVESTGNAAIRRSGDDLLIALCDPLHVETIAIGTAKRTLIGDGFVETNLLATGDTDFPAGYEFSTDSDLKELTVQKRLAPRLDEANEVSVIVSQGASVGASVTAFFTLVPGSLPSDAWLQLDGSQTEQPCGD